MRKYKGHEIMECSMVDHTANGWRYYLQTHHHTGIRWSEEHCPLFRSLKDAKTHISDLVAREKYDRDHSSW